MYKKILWRAISWSAIMSPISALSCNMSINYKVSFWNYEDYMHNDSIDEISKHFNYKQFGDLPELEQSLKAGKSIGGISSDYYIVKMALRGYVKPLNFKKALKINYTNKFDLKMKLKYIYTKIVWKQMQLFNHFFISENIDNDKDGQVDELWEYMIPYFIQSKVLAFNFNRGNDSWKNNEAFTGIYNQSKIDSLFHDKSYLGLLKTLKNSGYNNFVINDYSRDNMMIGSEKSGKFTGKLTNENYLNHINGFRETFIEGLGLDLKSSNIKFETSGTSSSDLLLRDSGKWGASFLYNGDAMYAHNGGSDENISAGSKIRIVRPNNAIYLLDGLTLSSNATNQIEDKFYDAAYKSFLKGFNESDDSKISKTMNYKNYNFVGYTTPYQKIYNYQEKIFHNSDKMAKEIMKITLNINDDSIISPINDELQYKYNTKYIEITTS